VITFIEKETFTSTLVPGQVRQLTPIFMVKDGKEYFMFNRWTANENDNHLEVEMCKETLLSNNGQYFSFYCNHRNPLDLIADIKERQYHFARPEKVIERFDNKEYGRGFTDFSGNLVEVSAAFHYRIFCKVFAKKIKDQVETLIGGVHGKRSVGKTGG